MIEIELEDYASKLDSTQEQLNISKAPRTLREFFSTLMLFQRNNLS